MMRRRLIATLFVLLGLTLPVQAQRDSRPVESVSREMISATLGVMCVEFQQDQDSYFFQLQSRPVSLHRLDNGNRLLVRAKVARQPSLEALNRYNAGASSTTRAVRSEKVGVVLEAGVDCQLGVSEAGLKRFLTRFSDELADFEKFAANQPAGAGKDDPAPTRIKKENPKVAGKETPKQLVPNSEPKRAKLPVPMKITPDSDDKEFIITFPTHDPQNWETAWKIVWDMETAKQANEQGLKFPAAARTILFKIKKAYFKPGPKAEWIQVLEDAHPQEFYVPYYFRGTRFYDLRDVGGYTPLSPKEGGAVSQVLSSSKRVIAELRDTGTAYKHGNITRRGEELTLFANFAAANYTYMVEFGFRDEGTIVFRHSPTGYNYYPHFDASHMHGSYWRIGMKLGPDGNNDTNQVYAVRLPTDPKDQGDKGKLNVQEITKESFLDWNPQEFTRIRVSNPNYSIVPEGKDRPALPISYDLVTYPQGIARHERFKDEKFSLHDYWITRQDSPEKTYVNLGNYFFTPKGETNPKLRDLDKKNVVLWHSSSALHVPRSEDGIVGGNSTANGQAMIYWTTFELRPRNLFLKTPIYRSLP